MELTQEELDMLTPEELAGLQEASGDNEGGGNDDQGGDADAGTAGDAGDAAGAAAAAGADAAADAGADADAANAADAAAAAAAAADDAGTPAAAPNFHASPVPLIRPGQVENAEARTAELEKQLDDLATKFDAGDIDTADFLKQQRAVNKELNAIEMQQFRSELSQETTQARSEQDWYNNVGSFLNEHPELSKSPLLLNAYDIALRQVTGDDANAGKTDQEMLELARQNWARDLGITLEAAKPDGKQDAAAAAAAAKPAKPAASAADRPATPSLATAPAADASSVDDGRFAHLDRLANSDPLAFESALAKLSSSDRDQYLQFAG